MFVYLASLREWLRGSALLIVLIQIQRRISYLIIKQVVVVVAVVIIIIIIIIINRDLKNLPVIKHRSRLYNDGKKNEKKSEKKKKNYVKII